MKLVTALIAVLGLGIFMSVSSQAAGPSIYTKLKDTKLDLISCMARALDNAGKRTQISASR